MWQDLPAVIWPYSGIPYKMSIDILKVVLSCTHLSVGTLFYKNTYTTTKHVFYNPNYVTNNARTWSILVQIPKKILYNTSGKQQIRLYISIKDRCMPFLNRKNVKLFFPRFFQIVKKVENFKITKQHLTISGNVSIFYEKFLRFSFSFFLHIFITRGFNDNQ